MDFFGLSIEFEGADVEINLVIRIRSRAVDPASESRVLEALRQPRAEESDIKLVKTVQPDRLMLTADARACKQILLNLLSNAVKFTRRGGTVEVIAASSDGRVSLKVRDTGIGIPADLLPRLGNAFEQGSNDPMLAREGTGLGLSLAAAISRLHGASIELADNNPGLKVRLLFPLPYKSV